jgi:hypothetical protein
VTKIMGGCVGVVTTLKDVDEPSSSPDPETVVETMVSDEINKPEPGVAIEKSYPHSNRKIQKRSSQNFRIRHVHFAENDDGEILEQIRYITPRNSMSLDKLDKIWKVLDKDEDGLLNFNELFYFASTVFLDVEERDVREMLRNVETEEEAEGLNFTDWLHIVKNTDADIEVLVDDLYRVFCLGVEIADPDEEEQLEDNLDNITSNSAEITDQDEEEKVNDDLNKKISKK